MKKINLLKLTAMASIALIPALAFISCTDNNPVSNKEEKPKNIPPLKRNNNRPNNTQQETDKTQQNQNENKPNQSANTPTDIIIHPPKTKNTEDDMSSKKPKKNDYRMPSNPRNSATPPTQEQSKQQNSSSSSTTNTQSAPTVNVQTENMGSSNKEQTNIDKITEEEQRRRQEEEQKRKQEEEEQKRRQAEERRKQEEDRKRKQEEEQRRRQEEQERRKQEEIKKLKEAPFKTLNYRNYSIANQTTYDDFFTDAENLTEKIEKYFGNSNPEYIVDKFKNKNNNFSLVSHFPLDSSKTKAQLIFTNNSDKVFFTLSNFKNSERIFSDDKVESKFKGIDIIESENKDDEKYKFTLKLGFTEPSTLKYYYKYESQAFTFNGFPNHKNIISLLIDNVKKYFNLYYLDGDNLRKINLDFNSFYIGTYFNNLNASNFKSRIQANNYNDFYLTFDNIDTKSNDVNLKEKGITLVSNLKGQDGDFPDTIELKNIDSKYKLLEFKGGESFFRLPDTNFKKNV